MPDRLLDLARWVLEHVPLPDLHSPLFFNKLVTDCSRELVQFIIDFSLLLTGLVAFRLNSLRTTTSSKKRSTDRLPERGKSPERKIVDGFRIASGVSTLAGIAGILAQTVNGDTEDEAPMESRALGSMGFNASVLGMGGIYICRGDTAEGIGVLDTALELGINYFDTATQYGNGESERRYGIWLNGLEEEGRRGEVFIATKTLTRGYDMASAEIEESFARLQTEYVDLLQIHAVNDMDTWMTVSSRMGSLRAIEQAKESGRVRHIGITGHKDPEVLLRAIEEYPFDSVLMPLGITDRMNKPFVETVLPECVARGISVVAMKVFAEGNLVTAGADLRRCLHYTLSLPVSTAIIGMGSPAQVIENVAWTKAFIAMTEEEKEALAGEIGELIDVEELWWKR